MVVPRKLLFGHLNSSRPITMSNTDEHFHAFLERLASRRQADLDEAGRQLVEREWRESNERFSFYPSWKDLIRRYKCLEYCPERKR